MEHYFRYATGHEYLDGRMANGSIGEGVDEARRLAIYLFPVVNGRSAHASGKSNCWDVQQEVCRAAERGVDEHGVAKGGVGENVTHAHAALIKPHQRSGRSTGHVEPD